MKFIAAPILILLLLTQIFSKWLLVFEYNLNKEYIAKTLCVNKAKPKLLCAGKCQLMKKMADEETATSNTSNKPIKSNIVETWYDETLSAFSLTLPGDDPSVSFAFYTLKHYPTPVFSFFRPPALS